MIDVKTLKGRRVRKDCEDLTGQQFHHWTVISLNPPDGGRSKWLVQCVCGKQSILPTYSLKNYSKSCGCKRVYAPRKTARPAPTERNAKPEYKAQICPNSETPEQRKYRVASDLLKASVRSGASLKDLLELADLPVGTSRSALLLLYPDIND